MLVENITVVDECGGELRLISPEIFFLKDMIIENVPYNKYVEGLLYLFTIHFSQHLPQTGQDQDCRLSKPTQPHVLQRRPQIPRPLRRIYQDATALLLLREAHACSGADSSTPSTLMLQAFILKEDLLAKTFIQSRLPMATRVLLAGKTWSKSPNIRCTSATHPCSSLEEPK